VVAPVAEVVVNEVVAPAMNPVVAPVVSVAEVAAEAASPNSVVTSTSSFLPPEAPSIGVSVNANGQINIMNIDRGANESTGLSVANVTNESNAIRIGLIDAKAADVQLYAATLSDGADLPSWASIDPVTGTVTAEPPPGVTQLMVRVEARDMNGQVRFLIMNIDLTQANGDTQEAENTEKASEVNAKASEVNVSEQTASQGFMSFNELIAQEAEEDEYGQRLWGLAS
jgi:hypothetical protein